jgi:GNAT superfamily N-acetyltransferase
MPYLPNLHKEDEIRLWIRDILLSGHEVVVAEVGDRPAGFAALDGDELAHLYVHPGLQGRGIGDALLARVQELRPAGFGLGSSSETRAPGGSTSGVDCISSN